MRVDWGIVKGIFEGTGQIFEVNMGELEERLQEIQKLELTGMRFSSWIAMAKGLGFLDYNIKGVCRESKAAIDKKITRILRYERESERSHAVVICEIYARPLADVAKLKTYSEQYNCLAAAFACMNKSKRDYILPEHSPFQETMLHSKSLLQSESAIDEICRSAGIERVTLSMTELQQRMGMINSSYSQTKKKYMQQFYDNKGNAPNARRLRGEASYALRLLDNIYKHNNGLLDDFFDSMKKKGVLIAEKKAVFVAEHVENGETIVSDIRVVSTLSQLALLKQYELEALSELGFTSLYSAHSSGKMKQIKKLVIEKFSEKFTINNYFMVYDIAYSAKVLDFFLRQAKLGDLSRATVAEKITRLIVNALVKSDRRRKETGESVLTDIDFDENCYAAIFENSLTDVPTVARLDHLAERKKFYCGALGVPYQHK